jgi:hypothetical protein
LVVVNGACLEAVFDRMTGFAGYFPHPVHPVNSTSVIPAHLKQRQLLIDFLLFGLGLTPNSEPGHSSCERWRLAGKFQFSASDWPAGRRRSQGVCACVKMRYGNYCNRVRLDPGHQIGLPVRIFL